MNDASASPSLREPLALRLVRTLLLLGLATTLTFLLVLAMVALLNPFFWPDQDRCRTFMRVTLVIALALPIGLVWLVYRLRLRSWWWLGGGGLAVAPVLVYLAADDPVIRRPMSLEEIAPAFPGAEDSYRVLLRYAKNSPAALAFKTPPYPVPRPTDDLAVFAAANRAAVEAAWAELAPVRQWYDELTAFPRIGDIGPARYDAPIPAFAPHQAMARVTQMKAVLLALDGRGDAAIAILLPVLDVGRKMQVTSRTMVRSLTGMTNRRTALQAVELTLARTTVSPAMRARLLAVLGSGGGEAGARRLVAIEYAYWTSGTIIDFYLGPNPSLHRGPNPGLPAFTRGAMQLVAPLLINPRRSVNEAGEIMAELQDLAARRQPVKSRRLDQLKSGPLNIKNLGGQLAVFNMLPPYESLLRRYWDTEDLLAGLRARLVQS